VDLADDNALGKLPLDALKYHIAIAKTATRNSKAPLKPFKKLSVLSGK
jgi:hypothetical protein